MKLENIPTELKALPQWVNRHGKVPYNPDTDKPAKAGQPGTWVPFDKAVAAASRYDGIGFEFADDGGIVGIDLDHVVQNGIIEEWAWDLVKRLNSYTEYSPSGTGLHIFVKGKLPENGRKKEIDKATRQAVELYQAGRYFTVTGEALGDCRTIEPRQKELDELWADLFPVEVPRPATAPPIPLYGKDYLAEGLRKDQKLIAIWNGYRASSDESTNDQAFMNKLAYWCNRNVEQMIQAFLSSPYAKQKDDKHWKKAAERKDYLLRTATKAAKDCKRTAAEDDEAFQREQAKKAFPQVEGSKKKEAMEDSRISIDVVKKALQEIGVSLRYNLLLKEAEVRGLPSEYSKENAVNTLPVYLMDYLKACGVKGSTLPNINEYLSCIADQNRYNPVEEYLQSGTWDRVDRLPEIYRILGVSAPKYKTYIRKWCIQCVALALNDEEHPIGGEGVLVLQGPQGLAKTSFFRILSPFPRWFVEGLVLDVRDKDSMLKALSGLIAELGELDSTLKREQSSLKAFITAPEDRIRPPYGRTAVRTPRRTSFCGTVNPENYLRDETGSRRFWTVPVTNVDKKALFSLSREWVNQLWFQVYEMYQQDHNGFRLTTEEMKTLQQDNRAFEMPMPCEMEVRALLNYDLPQVAWEWWRAVDIANLLGLKDKSVQVGKVLSKVVLELPLTAPTSPKPTRKYQGYYEYFLPLKRLGSNWVEQGKQGWSEI